jgi:hypothetical protein
MEVEIDKHKSGLCVGFDLLAEDGTVVFRTYDTDNANIAEAVRTAGRYTLTCTIPSGLLHGKTYGVAPRMSIHNQKWILNLDPVVLFKVTLDHGQSPYWAILDGTNRPGVIAPVFKWLSEVHVDEQPSTVGASRRNEHDAYSY